MVHGDDPKHEKPAPAAPKAPEAKPHPAPAPKKEAASFAKVLAEVDPETLRDEAEALQAAYDAIPHLPSPKDTTFAHETRALREKIRTTVGAAHAGVIQAIERLKECGPLLARLEAANKAADAKAAKQKQESAK